MELHSTSLQVQDFIDIQAGDLLHVYKLTGAFCATDALKLKQVWTNNSGAKQLLIDLRDVTKIDLIAINALALAHKQNALRVIMPLLDGARQIFHVTKFTQILSTLENVPEHQLAYA